VEENGWFEERREKPEYGARTDTSCKLQNAMQLLLEALQFRSVLYFEDGDSGEDTAGDGLSKTQG
jgi:hypothetical protein